MTTMRQIVAAAAMIATMTAAEANSLGLYDSSQPGGGAGWQFYQMQQQQELNNIYTRNAINAASASNRRSAEALINEMRAARGAPPCTLGSGGWGLLGLVGEIIESTQPNRLPRC